MNIREAGKNVVAVAVLAYVSMLIWNVAAYLFGLPEASFWSALSVWLVLVALAAVGHYFEKNNAEGVEDKEKFRNSLDLDEKEFAQDVRWEVDYDIKPPDAAHELGLKFDVAPHDLDLGAPIGVKCRCAEYDGEGKKEMSFNLLYSSTNWMTSFSDFESDIKRQGYRPATVKELLSFVKHCSELDHVIVALAHQSTCPFTLLGAAVYKAPAVNMHRQKKWFGTVEDTGGSGYQGRGPANRYLVVRS